MTPLEIATKAYREEESLWHVKEDRHLIGREIKLQFIVCRHQTEIEALHLSSTASARCYELRSRAAMRAALRALAAMEPTEGIKKAFWNVNDMPFFGDICTKTWSGMIIAAAEEGEKMQNPPVETPSRNISFNQRNRYGPFHIAAPEKEDVAAMSTQERARIPPRPKAEVSAHNDDL
jgi:hypothetical protein